MAAPKNSPGKWATSSCAEFALRPASHRGRNQHTLKPIPEARRKESDMATTTQPTTSETAKKLINYRKDAGVGVIEMFDPPANTYTYEMNRQLDDAILQARMDNDVYVIVLTGSGDKFFSAGANIKMLASVDPTFKYYFCLHANE